MVMYREQGDKTTLKVIIISIPPHKKIRGKINTCILISLRHATSHLKKKQTFQIGNHGMYGKYYVCNSKLLTYNVENKHISRKAFYVNNKLYALSKCIEMAAN
jgi:hypothetical protein